MDILGNRKKIGIVVPSTNTIVQPECELLKPRGVTNHVGRSILKTTTISDQRLCRAYAGDARRDGQRY